MVLVVNKSVLKLIGLGSLVVIGFLSIHFSRNQPVDVHKRKYIAIVIDDFGGYAAGVNAMMALNYPLTFAVLPYGEFASSQAETAYKKGFEVIVHLPFESYKADPKWYGKKYISATASREEIRGVLQEVFTILPMAKGLNNHMGSKATSSPEVVKAVLLELAQMNRFYFDSKTSLHSPAPQLARELAVPFIERDVFLDHTASREHVRKQLNLLMACADKKGKAVGIGHVGPFGPALAKILGEELPQFEKKGFKLVHLSDLIYAEIVKQSSIPRMLIGIDPGHGGIDSGTRRGEFKEKDLNLAFSKNLAGRLQNEGYVVALSRTEDKLLTPYCHYKYKNRPYKRNDLQLRLQKLQTSNSSIIVSIHANWSRVPSRRGAQIFYSSRFPEAGVLANAIQNELNTATKIRKIAKPGDYYLLNHAEVPAILIELGYFSNHEEFKNLHNKHYQERLINAIILGLKKTSPLPILSSK